MTPRPGAKRKRPTINLIWRWYDLWVGAYWDAPRKTLYLFPVPTLGLKINWKPRNPDDDE